MFYLLQEQIIDDYAHDTWKTATLPTAIDEEGYPAEPAMAIQRFVLTSLLLINNFFN